MGTGPLPGLCVACGQAGGLTLVDLGEAGPIDREVASQTENSCLRPERSGRKNG